MVFRLGRLSKLDSRSCAEFGNVMTVLKVFPLFEEGLSNNSSKWKAITLPQCPAVGISSRRRWFWAFWRMRSRGAFCRHSSPVKLGGRRRGSASEACLSYRSWSVRCAACLWSFCCRLVAFEGNLVILLHIFLSRKFTLCWHSCYCWNWDIGSSISLYVSQHLVLNDYQMCLSYQVYAPIFGQDRCFHRTLFLFCCKSPECYKCNDSRCMKGNFGFWNFSSLFVLLCNSIPDSKCSLKPESSVQCFLLLPSFLI